MCDEAQGIEVTSLRPDQCFYTWQTRGLAWKVSATGDVFLLCCPGQDPWSWEGSCGQQCSGRQCSAQCWREEHFEAFNPETSSRD